MAAAARKRFSYDELLSSQEGLVEGRLGTIRGYLHAKGRRYRVYHGALLGSEARYRHRSLPSPERRAALHGEEPRARPRPDNQHARAVLDARESAVPELIRLLDDPRRRTLALYFLAEIGGERAAAGFLVRWRALRDKVTTKRVYRKTGRGTLTAANLIEGMDAGFFSELLQSLGYAGGPVSAGVAADVRTAVDEAERLHAAGAQLRFKQSEGTTTYRWSAGAVETACEGLVILAMVGASEAPALCARALRSPVGAIQWEAAECVTWLRKGRDLLLPVLGELLDEPIRDRALVALAWLLDRETLIEPLGDARPSELVKRYKQRLRELGCLPR